MEVRNALRFDISRHFGRVGPSVSYKAMKRWLSVIVNWLYKAHNQAKTSGTFSHLEVCKAKGGTKANEPNQSKRKKGEGGKGADPPYSGHWSSCVL